MAAHSPSADEINVFDSLDERVAVQHFLGKELAQARSLFGENFLYHIEDLIFRNEREITSAFGLSS